MSEFSDLGPIDVQIEDLIEKGSKPISSLDEFKSTEFLRDYAVEILDMFTLLIIRRSGMAIKEALHEAGTLTTAIMRPLYEQLDPLEIGAYKRALAIGEEYATRLLALTKNPRRKEIVEALVSKYPSHEFAIDREEARSLGLPVYPLEAGQESLLHNAMEGIVQNGESVYGFVQVPQKKVTAQPPRKKKPASVSPSAHAASSG